jgi:hypothetical protein
MAVPVRKGAVAGQERHLLRFPATSLRRDGTVVEGRLQMGDFTEGLELRCSRCRGVAERCTVCGRLLNVGAVRCAVDGGHHHEACDAERRRRLLGVAPRSEA